MHLLFIWQLKYYFKSFCMKIWARWPYIHLSVVFPSECSAGPHFVTQPILLSENIPNIWHKSSTKHKEVRPDWNDKNDNANYAPSYHMEGLPMAQVAIFKEIFDQVRKDLDCKIVLFWTKTSQRLTLYFNNTDNIHIVLENDNTVLIKGLKKGCKCAILKNTHLIETSYDRLKSREITFQQYRENLAKAGVFRWVTNIHEHKRYYHTFDNSLLFTESIQNTTQIFPR